MDDTKHNTVLMDFFEIQQFEVDHDSAVTSGICKQHDIVVLYQNNMHLHKLESVLRLVCVDMVFLILCIYSAMTNMGIE